MLFRKGPNGAMLPADQESADYVKSLSLADLISAEFTKPRNPKFHRKFFALLNYAYGLWSERIGKRDYKGHEVLPNFERFRSDVTILAGFYDATFDIRGETRLQAKSISFGRMSDDEFADLYSKVIDVLLQKVFPDLELTEADLTRAVDDVLTYC